MSTKSIKKKASSKLKIVDEDLDSKRSSHQYDLESKRSSHKSAHEFVLDAPLASKPNILERLSAKFSQVLYYV